MTKVYHKNIPASYLVPIQDGKILLLRRANTGFMDGHYSLVAGHVDPGETFTECLIREAKEEAWITIHSKDVQVSHIMHRDSGFETDNERIDAFFTINSWEGEIVNKEPHKCDDLAWFSLDNLPENTIPYVKLALECIRDGIHYSEHGWKR